jgi:hypothetical protein
MYYDYETVEFYFLMDWMLLNGWHFLIYLGGSGFKSHIRLLILSDISDDFSHTILVYVRVPHQIRLTAISSYL